MRVHAGAVNLPRVKRRLCETIMASGRVRRFGFGVSPKQSFRGAQAASLLVSAASRNDVD
jgi:hypothetical protein